MPMLASMACRLRTAMSRLRSLVAALSPSTASATDTASGQMPGSRPLFQVISWSYPVATLDVAAMSGSYQHISCLGCLNAVPEASQVRTSARSTTGGHQLLQQGFSQWHHTHSCAAGGFQLVQQGQQVCLGSQVVAHGLQPGQWTGVAQPSRPSNVPAQPASDTTTGRSLHSRGDKST